MTATGVSPEGGGLPWKWLIWLPVLASVLAGTVTVVIAIRHADQPLPETVTRTGPVLYGEHLGVGRARALGLRGEARIDAAAHVVTLSLEGDERPANLSLRLWHPTQARQDLLLTLTRGDDGIYRSAWPTRAQGLRPLLSGAGWELPGAFEARGARIVFRP